MRLTELKIHNLRNIDYLSVQPASRFNLIYGDNGTGKTSFLEAIYLLGHGRSFRSHISKRIISYATEQLTIYAQIKSADLEQTFPVAIQRHTNGDVEMKFNGQPSKSISALAKELPILLIHPDSYELLAAGPMYRRHFLDWGLFHVEQSYFAIWQRFQRALKQRNAALRLTRDKSQITAWDDEFVNTSQQIDIMRSSYFHLLVPEVIKTLQQFLTLDDLSLEYKRGWKADQDLSEALKLHLESDLAVGHTQSGPQRADIKINVKHMPAQDILSRGQQKLLVIALRLAQGQLLYRLTNKSCIYLLDDLSAELDLEKLHNVIHSLNQIESQTFITTLEPERLFELLPENSTTMFHVEHLLNRVSQT